MTDKPMRLTETGSVSQASQCGARTRSGAPCSRRRSRGGEGVECTAAQTAAGAPKGSKNGNYKHGRYTEGGCHPPLATRCRSYDPQAEQGQWMTIETTRA
jgi:hypothetical protein